MKVTVLGAGLLGVTSASFLRQLGFEVNVIDRQASPTAETSFANGGQIVRLGTCSRDTLQALRRDIGIAFDERNPGYPPCTSTPATARWAGRTLAARARALPAS